MYMCHIVLSLVHCDGSPSEAINPANYTSHNLIIPTMCLVQMELHQQVSSNLPQFNFSALKRKLADWVPHTQVITTRPEPNIPRMLPNIPYPISDTTPPHHSQEFPKFGNTTYSMECCGHFKLRHFLVNYSLLCLCLYSLCGGF